MGDDVNRKGQGTADSAVNVKLRVVNRESNEEDGT